MPRPGRASSANPPGTARGESKWMEPVILVVREPDSTFRKGEQIELSRCPRIIARRALLRKLTSRPLFPCLVLPPGASDLMGEGPRVRHGLR